MRTIATLVLLLGLALAGCGSDEADEPDAGASSGDAVAFTTELMHRDAALLNLLDVGLGRDLDPRVVTATDQLRLETVDRFETAADLFDEWGEKPPVTVRDHAFGHSSDHDVPELEGMPTGEEIQTLGGLPPPDFEAAYVRLLTSTLEATCTLAGAEVGDAAAARLAEDAASSCGAALDVLTR